jgi:hypothetical protein
MQKLLRNRPYGLIGDTKGRKDVKQYRKGREKDK